MSVKVVCRGRDAAGIDSGNGSDILIYNMSAFGRAVVSLLVLAGFAGATLPIRMAHSVERLANGNTLIVDGGQIGNATGRAFEVDSLGRLVWAYLKSDINWTHTARRLANGNTLITASAIDRVLEVNAAGDSVWSPAGLNYPNDAIRLSSGNTLITDRDNNRVIEVDPTGTVQWSYTQLLRPHNATRLPNGNTLVCDSDRDRVLEIEPGGSVVWSCTNGLNWPRCAQRLPGFHTLIAASQSNRVVEVDSLGAVVWACSTASPYTGLRLGNGNTLISSQQRVIEVNPGRQVVWQYPLVAAVVVETLWVVNPATGCSLYVHIHRPAYASAANRVPGVILAPSEDSYGSYMDGSGLPDNIARDGFVVLHFDPDGRGLSSAYPEDYYGFRHQDGMHACAEVLAAREFTDITRLGVYSLSYGVTVASGMIARYPTPAMKFLLDWEGPADRYQSYQDSGGHVPVPPDSESFWLEREAARFVKSVPSFYLRQQSLNDHNYWRADKRHCIQLIDSATSTIHGGAGISSWTRVNDSIMNPANRTYTMTDPPTWIPEAQEPQNLPRVLLYLHELADMSPLTGIRASRVVGERHERGLSVSPNPCRGRLRVRAAQASSCRLKQFEVRDVTGSVRKVFGLDTDIGSEIDLRDLPNGAYFLSVPGSPSSAARIVLLR